MNKINILIIRFTSLGDLVTLEPIFRAIKYFNNSANITFLTSNIGKGLYSDTDYFNEFILHNSFLSTVSNLKNKKFHTVINLQCNKPSHYINFFVNKKYTINKSYNFFQKLFHIKTHSKSMQEILEALNIDKKLIKNYILDKKNSSITLPVSKENRYESEIKNKFTNKKIIAISVGTSKAWESKKWGKENFKNLISLLKNNFGIILVGSKLELDDTKEIMDEFKGKILSFVNKTNLTELKSVISLANLYLGNDSGPTHIAAALGIKTVTIFGSTDIKHSVSFIHTNSVHTNIKPSSSIICHPCYKKKCPTEHECMKDISVESVYKEVINALEYS